MVCIHRFQLPIVFLVMNNSGIYRGVDTDTWNDLMQEPDLPLRYSTNCSDIFFSSYVLMDLCIFRPSVLFMDVFFDRKGLSLCFFVQYSTNQPSPWCSLSWNGSSVSRWRPPCVNSWSAEKCTQAGLLCRAIEEKGETPCNQRHNWSLLKSKATGSWKFCWQ